MRNVGISALLRCLPYSNIFYENLELQFKIVARLSHVSGCCTFIIVEVNISVVASGNTKSSFKILLEMSFSFSFLTAKPPPGCTANRLSRLSFHNNRKLSL